MTENDLVPSGADKLPLSRGDRGDYGMPRSVQPPMIQRVTSGRQRAIEDMLATYVICELGSPSHNDFAAIVRGIQTACAENGLVLTEEPFAADLVRKS